MDLELEQKVGITLDQIDDVTSSPRVTFPVMTQTRRELSET